MKGLLALCTSLYTPASDTTSLSLPTVGLCLRCCLQVWTAERSTQLGMAVSSMLKGYTTTAAQIITAMLKSVTKFTIQVCTWCMRHEAGVCSKMREASGCIGGQRHSSGWRGGFRGPQSRGVQWVVHMVGLGLYDHSWMLQSVTADQRWRLLACLPDL